MLDGFVLGVDCEVIGSGNAFGLVAGADELSGAIANHPGEVLVVYLSHDVNGSKLDRSEVKELTSWDKVACRASLCMFRT